MAVDSSSVVSSGEPGPRWMNRQRGKRSDNPRPTGPILRLSHTKIKCLVSVVCSGYMIFSVVYRAVPLAEENIFRACGESRPDRSSGMRVPSVCHGKAWEKYLVKTIRYGSQATA